MVIEVEISSLATPPFMIVIEIISHLELCCYYITAYRRSDTVQLEMDGLSEGTLYRANLSVENQRDVALKCSSFSQSDSNTTERNTTDSTTTDSTTTNSDTTERVTQQIVQQQIVM